MKHKTLTLLTAVIVAVLAFAYSSNAPHSQAQVPSGGLAEFSILQPFTNIAPGQTIYNKVGTIGLHELAPCVAAVKVWNNDYNAPARVVATCRVQSDGYVAVSFTNSGQTQVAVYDKIRVIVFR